jgi:uncharacterized protein involved in cysteine biosynthesis
MRERYIAPAVMLIAGAIISILNIIDEVPVLDGLIRILVVLIIFYILGKIITVIIRKATTQKQVEEKLETSKAGENIAAEEEVITKDQ